ncbi:MAG: ABC transporter permease [Thermomicrobiales bacterium]|nr:ABC transporter permease [Thermomicrobiales bacterium]MCO5222029.1 ABC transporter permease [Thermomicrobiales bacterium]
MSDSLRSRGLTMTVLTSVAAVAVALLVGAIFILLSQQNPVTAYKALLEGAFGSRRAIGETLAASTPYIFGGLAFAVAYRAGLFNIGIEGQMVMGGLAAGVFAAWNLDLPRVLYIPCALLVAAVAGGIWGAIAGALKAVSGAHEVITTIMLNYLAFQVLSYTLLRTEGWLPVNPQLQATKPSSPDARLPNILSGTRLHAGLLLGLLMALLVWYLLFRTTFGYRLRTVGLSKGAAAYAGMRWGATITIAMFISGALGGLGGASETLGLLGQQYNAPQGYGFASIAVGLVGRNNPFGVVLAALLFGTLRSGSTAMQNQAGTSKELVLVLQGLVILAFAALAASGRVQSWWAKRRGQRFDEGTDTVGVEPGVAPEL